MKAEIDRILSMSDAELVAQAKAECVDIHATAEHCRAEFAKIVARIWLNSLVDGPLCQCGNRTWRHDPDTEALQCAACNEEG